MKAVTCFIILVGAAASVLCAAQPAGTLPAATQASSAPVQITLAPPRAAPAASERNAAATQNVLPGPLPELHGTRGDYAGYTRFVINGQELECRNDVATGSRTERHMVCLTPAQVAAQQVRAQDYVNKVQRSGALSTFSPFGMSPAM
jgi:hypothetical protein